MFSTHKHFSQGLYTLRITFYTLGKNSHFFLVFDAFLLSIYPVYYLVKKNIYWEFTAQYSDKKIPIKPTAQIPKDYLHTEFICC